MPKRILIVDDDFEIRTICQAALNGEGYITDAVGDGKSALEELAKNAYELVVLDIVMPGASGIEVCQEIRKTSEIPVIFLSGRREETDRIVGLEIGADDYLTKPFNVRELIARVRAILRRVELSISDAVGEEGKLTIGKLTLDRQSFTTKWGDEPIELTKTEFFLLFTLAKDAGLVRSRTELMSGAYEDGIHVSERTIDSHIRHLRKKLLDVGVDDAIQTVRAIGFRLAIDSD